MNRFTFDRLAASGGIIFTVLAVSTLVVAPVAPAVDAPATEVRRWLTDHPDRLGVSVGLMVLAVLAVSLAFGYVHRQLAVTDRGSALPACFLVAAAAAVSMALAGAVLQGLLVQYMDGVDDSTLLAIYRTWQVVAFMGPPLPIGIALALAGARTLRERVFPQWTGWVALASAAGGIVTALINLGTDAQAPAVLDIGSFLLNCVWLVGVAISSYRTPRTATAPIPVGGAS